MGGGKSLIFFKHFATKCNFGDYFCYVGRLSEEKGVRTLVKAASRLPFTLKIAGDGPIMEELRREVRTNSNVEFLGMLQSESVNDLLKNSRFSVLPSEWYENNPMGIIESLCAGTPVLGAAIGGIPELIDDDCGATFDSGSVQSLADAATAMWDKAFDRQAMQRRSLKAFSPKLYYSRLMDIYG